MPLLVSSFFLVPIGESGHEPDILLHMLLSALATEPNRVVLEEAITLCVETRTNGVIEDLSEDDGWSYYEVICAEEYLAQKLLPRYKRKIRKLLQPKQKRRGPAYDYRLAATIAYLWQLFDTVYEELGEEIARMNVLVSTSQAQKRLPPPGLG